MTILRLNFATGLAGASALGLMFGAYGNGSTAYHDHESSFIFAKVAALETMIPLMIGGAYLLVLAFWTTKDIDNKGKRKSDYDYHKLTAGFAVLVMVGICMSLFNGFRPEMTSDSWNQPSNDTEKGIFGGLWGGFLALSTGVFCGHLYKAYGAKLNEANEGNQITPPILT